mgnify:FL=1
MESAVAELEELYKRSFKVSVKDVVGPNPELIYAYRTQKMLRVALSVPTALSTARNPAALTTAKTPGS